MDITRTNFDEGYAKIAAALASPRLAFVSIDLEMTGISLGGRSFRDMNRREDTAAERYARMRPVATAFGIVQFGVTAWLTSRCGGFLRASSFNMFTFPGDAGGDVLLSPGAIAFLALHKMDFATWLALGVPFVDAAGERRLEVAPPARSRVELRTQQQRDFAAEQLGHVQELYDETIVREDDATPRRERLLEQCDDAFLRRYLYQEMEARFPELETEKRAGNRLAAIAWPRRERAAREKLERDQKHAATAKAVGARRVYQLVSAACQRVPLVGHNCLFDLLFLVRHFDQPLPPCYAAWKRLLHARFPLIADTKAMVLRVPDVGRDVRSDLGSLFAALKSSPLCKTQIEFEHGFDKYGGAIAARPESDEEPEKPDAAEGGQLDDEAEAVSPPAQTTVAETQRQYAEVLAQPAEEAVRVVESFHEAGWDSYMTGVVFSRLEELLGSKGEVVPMNRLHLMQSPREIANRAPPSASRAAAAELVEPLQRHARGYYVHLRIRAKKDATPLRWHMVEELLLDAAGKPFSVTWLGEDGQDWLCDLDAPLDAAALAAAATAKGLEATSRPWLQFELETAQCHLSGRETESALSLSTESAASTSSWKRWLNPFALFRRRAQDSPSEPPRKRKFADTVD